VISIVRNRAAVSHHVGWESVSYLSGVRWHSGDLFTLLEHFLSPFTADKEVFSSGKASRPFVSYAPHLLGHSPVLGAWLRDDVSRLPGADYPF